MISIEETELKYAYDAKQDLDLVDLFRIFSASRSNITNFVLLVALKISI